MPDTGNSSSRPSIGYIQIGGALVGSQVRDIRMANELSRRGCRGHVWWAMDRVKGAPLDPEIEQDWLFHCARNAPLPLDGFFDRLGRTITWLTSDERRTRILQKHSWYLARMMRHLIRRVCKGVETDNRLIRRFARQIDAAGLDYLLPNLAIFAPYVQAASRLTKSGVPYTVTFQGYELYSRYAREIGLEKELFQRFREAVEASDSPAVAVSEDYRQRVHADVGIPLDDIIVIPPGIPEEPLLEDTRVRELVSAALPNFDPELPLVSYVGRQDSEKGIDLLLYAARILQTRGIRFQLAVCGTTAFGGEYATVLRNMADQLEVPVLWHGYMTKELRTAIFQASHCTIYPSIHQEPFGMVPVESMMLGTPAIVADTGGVAELVSSGDKRAGLNFRSWDSADLAEKIRTIIEDRTLYRDLAGSARELACRFSAAKLGDRILELIGRSRLR